MANHASLPDSQLHEPKGAAYANEGMVYRADGAGSGVWTYVPTGWGFYQDDGSAQAVTSTPTKLSVDSSGSLTNEQYLPRDIRGTGSLWSTVDNRITPVRDGDGYDVRIDLPIASKSGSPTELAVALDIGADVTPTTVILKHFIPLTKTPPYTVSFSTPLVGLSALTASRGIQLFLSTDTGSVVIEKPSILIKKDSDGAF